MAKIQVMPNVLEEEVQGYEDLIRRFSEVDYERNEIRLSLDSDPEKTLNALVWATENGRINVGGESGKCVWRGVVGTLCEKGMVDELYQVEGALYGICRPTRKELTDINSDSVGLFWMGATLGTLDFLDISDRRKGRIYHEFVVKNILSHEE